MSEPRELLSRSIIVVDKPSGLTSRETVDRIKKLLSVEKAGHCGTLDTKVTGVLIVALGEATKAVQLLMGLDKEYEGVMYLHKDIDLKKLREIVNKHFIGEIVQTPPVKSAVARKPRKRKVYSFRILRKDGKNVYFKTKVEAGTYIRKLCSDIGEKLGIGAHMKKLRRTKVGHFRIDDAYNLSEIQKKNLKKILVPIEDAIPHIKKVHVKDYAVDRVHHGTPLFFKDLSKVQQGIKERETVAIFSNKMLIALGEFISNPKKTTVEITRAFR